jgi:hypothetical protein
VTGDSDLQARMPEEARPQALPALWTSRYVTRDGEALSCSSYARMRESAASLRHNFMNSLRSSNSPWASGVSVAPRTRRLMEASDSGVNDDRCLAIPSTTRVQHVGVHRAPQLEGPSLGARATLVLEQSRHICHFCFRLPPAGRVHSPLMPSRRMSRYRKQSMRWSLTIPTACMWP